MICLARKLKYHRLKPGGVSQAVSDDLLSARIEVPPAEAWWCRRFLAVVSECCHIVPTGSCPKCSPQRTGSLPDTSLRTINVPMSPSTSRTRREQIQQEPTTS